MIFTDFRNIPYPFLHDAVFIVLCRGYKLQSVYMDSNGECSLQFNETLNEKAIKDVLSQLIPGDIELDKLEIAYDVHYSYSDDRERTFVYSPDHLNYKEL